MKQATTWLVSALLLNGCAGAIDGPPAEATGEIVGGATDTADPSVVAVFAQQNGSNQGSLCTATVISPTVLLTAAHCVAPAEVGSNVTFTVMTGTDWSNPTSTLAVAKTDYDRQFDPSNIANGHDIGVVVLAQPTSLKPLPFNRSSVVTGMAGHAARLVGYGNNDGQTGTGAGIKRQVTTTLDDVSSKMLHLGDSAHETCQGDSGGPAFMNMNGVETIVGVTSYGAIGCTGGGYDTRVDLYGAFLDGYVGGGPSTAPPAPAPAPTTPTACSESEPNDSASAADALCPDGHIDGAIAQAGDVDWFTYTVQPGQSYYVDLTQLPADYTMTVYKVVNGALSTIGSPVDNHDGADQEVARYTPSGGTYYVKVYGVNGAANSGSYRLTVHN